MLTRCAWCGDDPLYQAYHDQEWGVPVYADRPLFAMLVLEGAQAGLSWITILRKRPHYMAAFDQFDPAAIAAYDSTTVEALLNNPGIVRNRLKIEAAIRNARGYLAIEAAEGSFSRFVWQFVGGRPIHNAFRQLTEIPAQTPQSQAMSRALKGYGFNFVGPTICYAFMQAVGMVNDHTVDCFRYAQLTSGNTPL